MKKHLLPTAVAIFILVTCFAFSSKSEFSIENCPSSDIILEMTSSNELFEITLSETGNNEIIVCNLEIGKSYLAHVKDFSCAESPVFNAKSKTPSPRTTFQATNECYHLNLDNSCIDPNSITLLVKKISKREGQSDLLKMVPITTSSSLTATELIEDVFIGGGCFDVTNVQSIGPAAGIGSFSNGQAVFGFDEGIVFSTGNISNVSGPNNGEGTTTQFNSAGDGQLSQITSQSVNDAVGIEFDFSPTVETIEFRFVFASEEYCEFVNDIYNDVFGFFITGPGIAGPYIGGADNIAVLPGTNTAITINTVNNGANAGFFNPNSVSCGGTTNITDIEFDGYTTVITTTATVIPCETYHIKLVIADGFDDQFDSAVFLEAGSFSAGGNATVTGGNASGSNVIYENCGDDGFVTFVRETGDISQPLTITYELDPASTATPGVDYNALPTTITIPAGQTEITIPILAIADNIPEGVETIIINIDNSCSCMSSTSIIEINDVPDIIIPDMMDQSLCDPDIVNLAPAIVGGAEPLTYSWSTGESTASISPFVNQTTTYSLTVMDACGASLTSSVTIEIGETPTGLVSSLGDLCASSNTAFTVVEFNFTGSGPWDLFYTIDGIQQSPVLGITDNPYSLITNQPGTYEITQLFSGACQGLAGGIAVVEEVVIEPFLLETDVSCSGNNDGSIITIAGGSGPYGYTWNNPSAGNQPNPTLLPSGVYTVTLTDQSGCTGTGTTIIEEPDPIIGNAVGNSVDCNNTNGGSIDLTVTGGVSPISYVWSSGDLVEDPSGLQAGTYSVTVVDGSGCLAFASATIGEDFDAPDAVANAPDAIGCNSAPVSINGNGSSSGGNFTYAWTTGDGNIVSGNNTLNPMVDAAGTYQIVVTNSDNGCSSMATVDVTQIQDFPNAVADAPQLLDCNNSEVMISGNGSSSGGNFTYLWTTSNGNIVSGETTLNPTVSDQGDYILTVINGTNGCEQTAMVTVFENTFPPSANAGLSQQIDCGNSEVMLSGSGSTGSNFTYFWTTTGGSIISGETTLTPTVGAEGTYQLIVTDNTNGCTMASTVNVTADVNLPNSDAGSASDITCNSTQVILDGNGSSSGTGYTYIWTTTDGNIISGDNTTMPTVDGQGTYQLQVTAPNGCTALSTVMVGENTTPPTADAGLDMSIDCSASVVNLDGSGSASNSTYLWTTMDGNIVSGNNTLNPSVDGVGTYILTVTDNATGCTSTASAMVNGSATLPNADAGAQQLIDCTNTQVTLDGSNSETGNITYLWTTMDGSIISGENSTMPIVDGDGTYTLLVTNNDNGCTQTSTVDVVQNIDQPSAIAGDPMVLTCTQDEVTLNGDGSSTNGDFSYQWNTTNGSILSGGTSLTPTVNAAGTYQIIVTNNNNGCTQEAFVDVTTDGNLPNAEAGTAADLTCNTSQIILSGNGSMGGNITYLWTTTDGSIVSDETTLTPTVDGEGTYQLLVSDGNNGCTAISTVTVGENIAPPTADAGLDVSIDCGTTETTLDGSGSSSGGFSYVWTTQDGSILSGETTLNPTVDAVGTYQLMVTNDATGCTSLASADVISSVILPIAEAGADQVIDCNNSQTTLDGTNSEIGGDITYLWTTMDGNILSGENSLMPTVDGEGTYTLIVSNGGNGCSAISNVLVEQNIDQPIAVATTNASITCTQDEVTLNGNGSSDNGNFSYEWTTQNGNILSGENTLTPTVNAVGTYQILVTNTDNGCTQIASVDVEVDGDIPFVEAGTAADLTCNEDQVTLNGSGATGANFTYTWTTMDGSIISGEDSLTPTVNAIGTYQLQVSDSANGCTAISTVTVGENVALPEVTIPTIDTLSCIVGTVNVNASNLDPNGTFTYIWTTPNGNIVSGENTLNPTVSEAGDYVLEMTNTGTGCMSTATVFVPTDEQAPIAEAGAAMEVNCNNNEITLDGSGSDAGVGYTYEWTQGGGFISNEISPTVATAGTYQLVVTNINNGCTSVDEVVVGENFEAPIVNSGVSQTLSCSQTSLQLNGNGSSFGTEYTYEWTTQNGNIISGENTLTPEVNAAGDYQLEITNTLNGCTSIESVNIAQDSNVPTAAAGTDDLLNCNITNLVLDGNMSSSGIEFSYEWTTTDGNIVLGENTLNPEIDAPGDYLLVVTNNTNGCTAPSTVTIGLDATSPVVEAGNSQFLSCTNNSVSLSGMGSSTGNDYSYEWVTQNGNIISGETTLTPEVNATGTYELIVTSLLNGCTSSDLVDITQDSSLPTADAGDGFEITCQVFDGTLDGTASSTGQDITFEWTTQDGNIVSGENTLTPAVNASGVYQLTLTNSTNGCTAISSVTILENNNEPTAEAGSTMELNCNNEVLTIVGTTPDTSTTLIYTWTSPDGNIVSGENSLAPSIDMEGTYELMITNTATGCMSSDNVIITSNFQAPTVDAGVTDELNCTQAFATLDGGNSSIGTGFIYQWTTPNGNIVSGENTLTPDVNMAGDYELLVTDLANGCTAAEVVTITESVELPTATAANAMDLTCTLTTLDLDGGNSSTGADFEYFWTTADGNISIGENTINPTIDEPGTYTLLVTNTANNCTAETEVIVAENVTPPSAEAGAEGLLNCEVTQTQLDGTNSSNGNDFIYQWVTQDGSIVSDEMTLNPTIGGIGTYELIVTSTINGCTANDFVDVNTDADLPDAVALAEGILTCDETTITLNGTGSATGTDITYQWTTTNGTIISGGNTINPTVGQVGDYTLLVSNGTNGCSNATTISVTENVETPTALIDQTSNQTLDCINSSVTIDGSGSQPIGNVSYQWTTSDGNILSGGNTPNPEVDDDGEYFLTITNLLNGCTAVESITILQDLSVPQINIGNPLTLTCDISETSLDASTSSQGNNYSYQWTTSDGNIVSGGTTLNPLINQGGIYQLTIIDLNSNCEDSEMITVLENTTPPIAEAGIADELNCQTIEVSLNGSGSSTGNNITYEWTTANGNIIGTTNSLSTSVDVAGSYSLQVTNTENGCMATDVVAVIQDTEAPSDIIYNLDLPECHGDLGNIFIETVAGGTGPYLYSIDGENFYSTTVFPVDAGDYTLFAQDSEGCETSINFSVPVLEPVQVSLEPEVIIELGEDYQIETLTNIPLTEIENIKWSPEVNLSCTDCLNPTVEKLVQAQTYEVTVTNIYGCTTSAKIQILIDKSRGVYIPNVFTPNGDNLNDVFMIFADLSQVKEVKSFLIYDRWGEEVHRTEGFPPMEPQYGWDGTFKGESMNPQVFVYWVEIEFIDGYIGLYEGDVALRR